MDRTQNLGVRVPPDIKKAVQREADAEDRSLASMVEKLLREALAARKAKK